MNRTHMFLSVLFLGVVGCGGNLQGACEDYVASAKACSTEACGDDQACIDAQNAAFTDTFCDSYAEASGDAAKTLQDQLDCYSAAYDSADCSTLEGLTEVSTAIGECAAAPAS